MKLRRCLLLNSNNTYSRKLMCAASYQMRKGLYLRVKKLPLSNSYIANIKVCLLKPTNYIEFI